MKNFSLSLAAVLLSTFIVAQTAYYSAISIATDLIKQDTTSLIFIKDDVRVHTLAGILKAYLPEKDRENIELTDVQVLNKFKSNPFIGKEIAILTSGGAGADISTLISKSLTSVGSLDVTNFADGMAKFLVERVKQELSTSFFERFKDELKNTPQLRILFPSTYNALYALDKKIYNYTAYLDLLRNSFQKDLTLLLPNIKRLIEDPCMDVVFKKFPEIRTILADALYLTNEINEGRFPGEALHNYLENQVKKDSLDKINVYLYPGLQTLDLLSQSIRSKEDGKYWISSDSLKYLFKDKITFQIYLGLVYQQAKNRNIQFEGKIMIDSLLYKYASKVDSLMKLYEPYIMGLADKGQSIAYYFDAIKDKQKKGMDKPTYQDYFSLYDASINFTEFLTQCPLLDNLISDDNKGKTDLDNYFHAARSLGNIYIDIYEKQYTSAVVEFTGLVNVLLESKLVSDDAIKATKDDKDKTLKSLKDKKSNISKDSIEKIVKKYDAQIDALEKNYIANKPYNDSLNKMLNINALVLKYGSFAASMAKAETSDDVKNAIEAAALPAGSSRVKRETTLNVSLNAYTGGFIGFEDIVGLKEPNLKPNSYGITAPIGIAVSTGTRGFLHKPCKGKGSWSYSGFVSVIDLGAVTAFRFANDTIDQVPTIQLRDIFSPGLFLSVGIPKCPISVNLGVQCGPNLRKIYKTEKDPETGEKVMEYQNQYQNNLYWRYSISVLVDIPIFNFYTKSE